MEGFFGSGPGLLPLGKKPTAKNLLAVARQVRTSKGSGKGASKSGGASSDFLAGLMSGDKKKGKFGKKKIGLAVNKLMNNSSAAINKKKDQDIFKVITIRYRKSAYPKLLEELD